MSELSVRRNVEANGVSDVDPARGAHAAVMKATKPAENILTAI